MHNFFAIETEAEMRRQEWERAAAADARAALALASPAKGKRRWLPLANRSLATLNLSNRNVPRPPTEALLELPRVPRPVAC